MMHTLYKIIWLKKESLSIWRCIEHLELNVLSQICGKHQILPQQMFSEEDLLNSDVTNIMHLKKNIIYAHCK